MRLLRERVKYPLCVENLDLCLDTIFLSKTQNVKLASFIPHAWASTVFPNLAIVQTVEPIQSVGRQDDRKFTAQADALKLDSACVMESRCKYLSFWSVKSSNVCAGNFYCHTMEQFTTFH